MVDVRTICAWCGKLIKKGKLVDGKASHGICDECKQEVLSVGI